MAVKKIQFDGHTLIDLTSDTVAADKMLSGYTAHNKDGNIITGNIETATFSNVTTTTTEGTNVPLVTKGGYTGQRYLTGLTVPDNKTLGTLTNLGTISNLSCDGSDATIDTLTLEKNSSGWNKINTLNISMGEGPGSYAACIGTIYNRGGDSTTPGINSIINKNDDYGAYIGYISNAYYNSTIRGINNYGSILSIINQCNYAGGQGGLIQELDNQGTPDGTATITTLNNVGSGGASYITTLNNGNDSGEFGAISTLNNYGYSSIGTLTNLGTIDTINNAGQITYLNALNSSVITHLRISNGANVTIENGGSSVGVPSYTGDCLFAGGGGSQYIIRDGHTSGLSILQTRSLSSTSNYIWLRASNTSSVYCTATSNVAGGTTEPESGYLATTFGTTVGVSYQNLSSKSILFTLKNKSSAGSYVYVAQSSSTSPVPTTASFSFSIPAYTTYTITACKPIASGGLCRLSICSFDGYVS